MITGHTRAAGVIGTPIRHSLSPAIFNAAFAAAGLDWAYLAFEVPEGAAGLALGGMRALGLEGLSVTMPHKAAVLDGLDELSPDAEALGAVNCISRHGAQLRGDNTGPHTMENSMRKAYTARTFRIPSAEMVKRLKDNPQLAQIHLTNVIAAGGALPIMLGRETIGAAGASGAPGGDKDEACIKAGLDKVANDLK